MFGPGLIDVCYMFNPVFIDCSLNLNIKNIENTLKSMMVVGWCFMDVLLCYFILGAVAGSQLCCAVDTHIYIMFAALWLACKQVPPRFSACTNNCTLNRGLSTWTVRASIRKNTALFLNRFNVLTNKKDQRV